MTTVYVGATNGVYALTDGAIEPLGLLNERIWAIHAWRESTADVILAGSYGNGMFRSADGGKSWPPANDGLTASAFRCISADPLDPTAILAGTEPARLYRSRDGGTSWSELSGITRIDGYQDWYLPYSPRAGAIRNVYAPPGSTNRVFASVEVGGLLRSDDAGITWTCAPVIADDDIHHITGHPTDPNLLYASLGYAALPKRRASAGNYHFGGIGRSRDGGATWEKLEGDYTRATIIPSARPDLVLAGPSPDVGRNGRIVVSSNGGDTWNLASAGLDVPMPDMVELFVEAPDRSIWAITSGGRLLRAEPGDWHWHSALPNGSDLNVQSVSFLL